MMWQSPVVQRIEVELVASLEQHLETFYRWGIGQGLPRNEAESIVREMDKLLIEYHSFYYLQDERSLNPIRLTDYFLLYAEQTMPGYDMEHTCSAIRQWLSCCTVNELLPATQVKALHETINLFDSNQKPALQKTIAPEKNYIPGGLVSPTISHANHLYSRQTFDTMDEWLSFSDSVLESSDPGSKLISISYEGNILNQKNISILKQIENILCDQVCFYRWLERGNKSDQIEDEIQEAMCACATWLDKGLALYQTQNDKQNIFSIINRYDKTLWSLRHQAAIQCGRDIREFLL